MADLSWICGHAFGQLSRREHDWLFTFSEGVSLVVECPWRLLADGRIRVSSDDDGQQFGLPKPIDSATEATNLIGGRLVRSISVRPGVLDLLVEFDGGHALEVLPVSSGYEAWQVHRPADRSSVIAVGGGELARHVHSEPDQR
jgi:hypothetical protein